MTAVLADARWGVIGADRMLSGSEWANGLHAAKLCVGSGLDWAVGGAGSMRALDTVQQFDRQTPACDVLSKMRDLVREFESGHFLILVSGALWLGEAGKDGGLTRLRDPFAAIGSGGDYCIDHYRLCPPANRRHVKAAVLAALKWAGRRVDSVGPPYDVAQLKWK